MKVTKGEYPLINGIPVVGMVAIHVLPRHKPDRLQAHTDSLDPMTGLGMAQRIAAQGKYTALQWKTVSGARLDALWMTIGLDNCPILITASIQPVSTKQVPPRKRQKGRTYGS